MTVDEFIDQFMAYQLESSSAHYLKPLLAKEIVEVNKTKEKRWDQWSWNYGKNPKFTNTKRKRFDAGLVEVNYEVENGVISEMKIYGDFFGDLPVEGLVEKIVGVGFNEEDIKEKIQPISVSDYINGINSEEFIELLLK